MQNIGFCTEICNVPMGSCGFYTTASHTTPFSLPINPVGIQLENGILIPVDFTTPASAEASINSYFSTVSQSYIETVVNIVSAVQKTIAIRISTSDITLLNSIKYFVYYDTSGDDPQYVYINFTVHNGSQTFLTSICNVYDIAHAIETLKPKYNKNIRTVLDGIASNIFYSHSITINVTKGSALITIPGSDDFILDCGAIETWEATEYLENPITVSGLTNDTLISVQEIN